MPSYQQVTPEHEHTTTADYRTFPELYKHCRHISQ